MTSRPGSAVADAALRRRHDTLVAELREVDHWRRLVAARLDLAVAAVTAIEELPPHDLRETPPLPLGLRDLVGLPSCDAALPEAGSLTRLRAVLRDLDAYAVGVRAALRTTAAALGPQPVLERPPQQARPEYRPGTGARTTRRTASVIPFPTRPNVPVAPPTS